MGETVERINTSFPHWFNARFKEFKATVRCIPMVDEFDGPGKCIVTGEEAGRRVVIAKAY